MGLISYCFGVILFLLLICLIVYILIVIQDNKKKSMEAFDKADIEGAEQIFVEHRGEKIPIRRREIPMWNKLGVAERSAMLKTYKNAVKKGRIKKQGDNWIKSK